MSRHFPLILTGAFAVGIALGGQVRAQSEDHHKESAAAEDPAPMAEPAPPPPEMPAPIYHPNSQGPSAAVTKGGPPPVNVDANAYVPIPDPGPGASETTPPKEEDNTGIGVMVVIGGIAAIIGSIFTWRNWKREESGPHGGGSPG